MKRFNENSILKNNLLPVDIVFHASWWFEKEGIIFNEDFFMNPKKRVEAEKKMENALYERWGEYGLGKEREKNLPVIGPVHLAASYLIPEMLGCKVEFKEDAPPQVLCANFAKDELNIDGAFKSKAFRKFEKLLESLKTQYGYLIGDVGWSGILNLVLDLRGENIFLDMFDTPEKVQALFVQIADLLEKFTLRIQKETKTTSISVNRTVRHFPNPIFLHSECSHTMISVSDYEKYLLPIDDNWSKKIRPFGIHYCGVDPHRYAESFTKISNLDFLDVGWGGDIKLIRKYLPNTFLNIRLSPVEIVNQSVEEIKNIIVKLVEDSNNPWLTGVCCINMDHNVSDEKVSAIFEAVHNIRQEYKQNT